MRFISHLTICLNMASSSLLCASALLRPAEEGQRAAAEISDSRTIRQRRSAAATVPYTGMVREHCKHMRTVCRGRLTLCLCLVVGCACILRGRRSARRGGRRRRRCGRCIRLLCLQCRVCLVGCALEKVHDLTRTPRSHASVDDSGTDGPGLWLFVRLRSNWANATKLTHRTCSVICFTKGRQIIKTQESNRQIYV